MSINPAISGDGRIIGFESTEDLAGAGGPSNFRAIRAHLSVDPPSLFQIGSTRAVSPAISQDGSLIAFASKDDPLGTNRDGNSEIYLFDGAHLFQITNTLPDEPAGRIADGNFQPSLSDDGRYLAFSSNKNLAGRNSDGNLEIFVYDTAGAATIQLTDTTGMIGSTDAKISGNGQKIAYLRDTGVTPGAKRDLMIQDRGSSSVTVLASQVQSLVLTAGRAISDDGLRIVYAAETSMNSSQVFFYDGRNGDISRQVTALGTRSTEVPLHATISGDGKRIAFATRRPVAGLPNPDNSVELYTYDIPTTTFARVTSAPAEADCFNGSNVACEIVSSLNDDGTLVVFNFPRALSGFVAEDFENTSEIYAASTASRPAFGTLTRILNQASLGHEPASVKAVAPNSITAAFGSALANTTRQPLPEPNGTFPTGVAGTTVTVNGRSAQLLFVSPDRVHFVVPPETEPGTAEVIVTNADGFSSRGSVPILGAAPGIFTRTGDGIGEGLLVNADTLAEGPFDPTRGNLRLLVFATGVRHAGQTNVSFAGRSVKAETVVASPNMPGLDEVRVPVPADLRGAGSVSLVISCDGRDSNPAKVTFTGDAARNILINEVLADPPNGNAGDANHDGVRDGTQDEFVELVNGTSNELIGFGGWTIRTRAPGSLTEIIRFTFAPDTFLPAGEAIVVFGGGNFNPDDPVFGCAQVLKTTTSSGLSLTNSGLTVLIRDGNGNLIAQFGYGSGTELAGDNNQSLTRSPDITGAFVPHAVAAGAGGRTHSPGLRANGIPLGACPGHVKTVTIAPPNQVITVGETTQFTSQAFDEYGRVVTNAATNFTSDTVTIATVESVLTDPDSGVTTANVKALNPGTARLTASVTVGASTVDSGQATLTVTGPSLSISNASQDEGNSGTGTFTFTVSLSTPAPAPVAFDIATQDDTAEVADQDYVARALMRQTIPAGAQTYVFEVTVNGDTIIEPTETFFVNVTNVSGAAVSDGQGLGTIISDDVPKLRVNDVSKQEGDNGTTTVTFLVKSDLPAPAEGITFDISTQDSTATVPGEDYLARNLSSQTISAGETTYTFDVTIKGDTLVEPSESFFVNLTNVSGATLDDGQGVGTITNDDTPLLVINQVYGGGGNAGATYRNDFIEIFNRGVTTIDFSITPFSVQYAAATSNFSTNKTNITSGTLPPGHYFLIQEASGANGAALPPPDVSGGTINLSATAGKVALVLGTTNLPGSGCPFAATVVDFLGYGATATCSEAAAIPVSSTNPNARSVIRKNGCTDTNNNAADFSNPTTAPVARNNGTPPISCP